jgi:hypothetical protein
MCVRLGLRTLDDYVRARALVPPKSGCDILATVLREKCHDLLFFKNTVGGVVRDISLNKTASEN